MIITYKNNNTSYAFYPTYVRDVCNNSVPVGTKHSVACSKQIFVHARHARLMYVMSTYIRRPLPSEMRQLLPPG